jgi:hypothetical protein
MTIETWIDTLCDAFDFVYTSGGKRVQTYHLYAAPVFPAALDTGSFPLALSFPTGVTFNLGDGASYDIWSGKTEIHVTQNADKASLKFVLPFADLIRIAAASHVTLGGKVAYFLPAPGKEMSLGTGAYGQESEHWIYVYYWTVKELSTIQLSG